jgi:class 3 adenylate cyclase
MFRKKSCQTGRREAITACETAAGRSKPYDAEVSALPSGTVTFVFTDIEGSTGLLKQLGEGYGEVLAEHRRIVRMTFAAANGIEIDKQGDAFFFAFPRARDAVGAAVEVQRTHASTEWPDGSVVRVRMGLHTGEPAVDDEGYLGLDVVRAARICTAARGGQVLLSESTRALLGSALPDGVSVFALGERHLESIDEPERVYELAIEGVEMEEVGETVAAAPADRAAETDERDFERRIEEVGKRHATRIQEKVLRSLERDLRRDRRASRAGKVETPSLGPAGEDADADIESLAVRAASLQERILARVEEELRAKGISRDEPH